MDPEWINSSGLRIYLIPHVAEVRHPDGCSVWSRADVQPFLQKVGSWKTLERFAPPMPCLAS